MSTTTTTTETTTKTTTSSHKPKLLTKAMSSTTSTAAIAMPSISCSISPIASGSFYLPIKQKSKRNGRYHHHKHLRKPPSFDTYLTYSTASSTTTPCGYLTRTSSVSSSYSSISSLPDNEDVMYGYGYKSNNLSTTSLSHSPRLRRGSSAYRVRFAEDDGSSIVSSSSGGSGVDEWDDVEVDEEEDYILVSQQSSQPQYFGYHEKSASA